VHLCRYPARARIEPSEPDAGEGARSGRAHGLFDGDALRLAQENPARDTVFFAIGFETTTPATALAIRAAENLKLANFSVFCNHVLTPPAMDAIFGAPQAAIRDGRDRRHRRPGHVSCVIGSRPYEPVSAKYRRRCDRRFEPLDLMQAVLMLVQQLNAGRHEVENEYTRA